MSRSRYWTTAFLCASLLGFPRTSSAGLWDVIIEMSGPKMWGHNYECRLFDGSVDSCKPSGVKKTVSNLFLMVDDPKQRDMWLSLSGGYYYSVNDTKSDGTHYDWREVQMLTFDPLLEVESKSWPVGYSDLPFQLYHGFLGGTFNVIFVRGDPPTFANAGLKLRPIGVVIPLPWLPGGLKRRLAFDYSFDLRVYPERFTAEDFGKTPTATETGWEVVRAHVIGLRFK